MKKFAILKKHNDRKIGFLSKNKKCYTNQSCGLFTEFDADNFIMEKMNEMKILKQQNRHKDFYSYHWEKILVCEF